MTKVMEPRPFLLRFRSGVPGTGYRGCGRQGVKNPNSIGGSTKQLWAVIGAEISGFSCSCGRRGTWLTVSLSWPPTVSSPSVRTLALTNLPFGAIGAYPEPEPALAAA